jgi:mannose-6-phosphate isomerase-like protein (cupin superfamily)
MIIKKKKFLTHLNLQVYADTHGDLGVLELENQAPFEVKRLYYISNVPGTGIRGQHGHKLLQQVFICLNGTLELLVTDGECAEQVTLNKHDAVYLPSGFWRELRNFSADGICLVLASQKFEIEDYIFDFEEYLKWKQ